MVRPLVELKNGLSQIIQEWASHGMDELYPIRFEVHLVMDDVSDILVAVLVEGVGDFLLHGVFADPLRSEGLWLCGPIQVGKQFSNSSGRVLYDQQVFGISE